MDREMENIIYEAGYLMTYALSELNTQKEVNPIYFQIDSNYQRKTKEIRGLSLNDSIPKAVKKLEKNRSKTLFNLIIFPADIDTTNGERESTLIAMIYDNKNSKNLTISIPYSLQNQKIEIREYEIIDALNIDDNELIYLESIFNKGLLNFKQGSYIWQECFVGSKKVE